MQREQGVVVSLQKRNGRESYGHIASGGQHYIFYRDDLPVRDCYGHKPVLLAEQVSFEARQTTRGLQAINIKYLNLPPDKTIYDESYREDGVIYAVQIGHKCGYATRMTGESVFWHRDDVITYGSMEMGTTFRFRPAKPDVPHHRLWVCKKIEIYRDESALSA